MSEKAQRVVFLKDKKAEAGGLDPIFMVFLDGSTDNFTYYAHIGQHGNCSRDYLEQEHIIEAEPDEFSDLWDEVVSLGYSIEAKQIKEALFI